jgi:ABC-type multidrug transport system fused ATPase/permease subunit
MALFRLAEMSKGEVRIDGINTKVLNLTELRRRIAIVSSARVFTGETRGGSGV